MKHIYLPILLFFSLSTSIAAQVQEVVATGLNSTNSCLTLVGNQLYFPWFDVSTLTGGISKVDITQPIPVVPTEVLNGGNYWGLINIDHYLYINESNPAKTGRIDLNDANPAIEAVASGPTSPYYFARKGNALYLNNFLTPTPPIDPTMGIYKIDLSAPIPQTAQAVLTGILAVGIAIRGNDLFFSDGVSNIKKIDLTQTNPVAEVVVSNIQGYSYLTVNGAFLYISELSQIRRIDLSQANPVAKTVVANAIDNPTPVLFNGADMYWGQLNGDKILRIKSLPAVFPAFQKICMDATTMELGGASPSGGVYSGAHVVNSGDGENFTFNVAAAGVGIHPVTYSISGQIVTGAVEVVALPTVTLALPDTFYMTQAMPLTGIGGGSPAGGVYSAVFQNDEVQDDANGMTFSFLNGVLINGPNTIYYTYTDANGCSNKAEEHIYVSAPTSGVGQLSDLQAYVFPNPATGMVRVKGVAVQAMRVMDALGRLVLEQQTQQQEIDLSKLSAGVYTLVIDLGNGQRATAKVVKE